MGVIFRMALRNLKQHRTKSLIIGIFIAVGVAIVELGNGFLEATNRGMERDFRAHYSGDIMISAPIPANCQMDLFGISNISNITDLPQIPAIPDLEAVEKVVAETNGIEKATKIISAKGILGNKDFMDFQMEDQSMISAPVFFFFAGEKDTYFDMFPGQKITEGRMPEYGTNEILVDIRLKNNFKNFYKEEINIGDTILVAGANSNMILREAVIAGFYEQPDKDSCMFNIVYGDPNFTRAFADLTYGSNFTEDLPENIDTSITSFSEDDLFGDDFFDFDDDINVLGDISQDFDAILGDTSLRDHLNQVDDGAWHYILLKTKHPNDADKIIAELNASFAEKNIPAIARDWKQASGTFTSSVEGISILFTALVIILAVVVLIIIMNTMVISVIERTGEIGTMRALGGQKNFVRKIFYTESITLTVFSSLAGSVFALIMMAILNSFHITVTNDIAKMILGGAALRFIPTFSSIFRTILIITIGGLLANLYPVSAALKITPLKALSQGDE
ncbi:MAG: FtsX-like permease family protein [Treponema sp.]|nr:FtsX-like permease family protein [Treponema sp.]